MRKIVGYARVSTENQAYKSALRQQTERLLEAGAEKVYADVASRSNDRRESIQEILRLAASKEISTVLITRLDRVTSSPGLFDRLVQVFQQNNVQLIALDESIDVHSAEGEFVAGLQVQFAKRELNTIKLRVKKAHEHRRKKGKPNSQVPWGYRVENGRYELDHTPFLCLLSDRPKKGKGEIPGKTKAELGKDIIDIFLEVRSLGKAVNALHQKYGIYKFSQKEQEVKLLVFDPEREFEYSRPRQIRSGVFRWSRDGIKVYLTNPVLQGHTAYGIMTRSGNRKRAARSDWEIVRDTHPTERLISEEEAVRIQGIMATNSRVKGFGSADKRQLLTGLLFCAECGRVFKSQGVGYKGKQKRRTVYYQCRNWMERACSSRKMIEEEKAVVAIDSALAQRAETLANLAIGEGEENIDSPELKERKLQVAQLKLIPGNNPTIQSAIGDLESQIAKLQIEQRRKIAINQIDREALVQTVSDPILWATLPLSERQLLYERFVDRVVVREGEVGFVHLKV